MKQSILFRHWWVILIQGIIMIALSVVIFNNPGAVLEAMAFWLGLFVIATGLIGFAAWFTNEKADRDLFSLLGSIGIFIIGIFMMSKSIATMKAITLLFGLLVVIVGLALALGSWSGRSNSSYWWIIALLGIGAIIMGIKSMMDIYSGAQNISTITGTAALIAGIGLICFSFLKKKIVIAVKNKISEVSH